MRFIDVMYLFIIGSLCIKLYKVYKERKIYYHNYKSCLLVLSEFDKDLRDYLEKEGKI